MMSKKGIFSTMILLGMAAFCLVGAADEIGGQAWGQAAVGVMALVLGLMVWINDRF